MVVVAGLLRSVIGIGNGARLCTIALRQLGIRTAVVDLTHVLQPLEEFVTEPEPCGTNMSGGVLVVHVNPPELPLALAAIGRRALRHSHIVGYWHWELPDMPKSWRSGLRLVDEIWVSSQFVADAVRPHAKLPVYVVPHPVARPTPSGMRRSDLGIPEGAFVCVCAFDARSTYVRKNPVGVIRAFRMAFGNRSDAVLVMKIVEPARAPDAMRQIRREIGSAADIHILDRKLSTDDMAALVDCSDVVISLHRSEGFGLVLAEAMLLGKPVVATRWSGNMDFMNDNNSALIDYKLIPVVDPQGIYTMKGQRWAEPDIGQAAEWLRRLKEDKDLRHRIGATAARDAIAFFSLDRYREAIARTSIFDRVFSGTS